MKKQRGAITDGWMILIGIIVVLGLIGGITAAWTHYINGVDQKGFDRGKQETEAKYAKRDNDQLKAANAEINRLQNAARDAEAANRKQVDALTLKLSQELKANEKLRQADRDSIRSGSLVLRDPGKTPVCTAGSNTGAAAEARPGASGSNAGTGSELSPELAEFLVGEANRADAVVKQLTAAQALIVQDRVLCGGNP